MRVKNPIVLIYAGGRIFLWFARKLIVKAGLGEVLTRNKQPVYLKKIKIAPTPGRSGFRLPLKLTTDNQSLPNYIYLATQTLALKQGRIPWQNNFADIEDLFALHRWGWLLRLLVEFPSQSFYAWAQKELASWLDQFSNKKDGPVWEAYSVSERIVNGILFFCSGAEYLDQDFRERFTLAIAEQSQFLKNYLEYRGEEKTNNHFLNNARALYFAGQFLRNEDLSESGRLIFINELPKMLTTTGFLREESSHYHFLLTRSVLEVWWLARETKDHDFAAGIKPWAIKMLDCCHFFLVQNSRGDFSIPLIGDISPDFPPDWLLAVPFSKIAADLAIAEGRVIAEKENHGGNWSRLFGKSLFIADSKRAPQEFYAADGWLRLNSGELTVFWPIKPDGTINYHGHNDLNSFCLYYKGDPILIDPGRYDFQKTVDGRYGRQARAHNVLLVDGQEQYFLDWYGLMPKWALTERVAVDQKRTTDELTLAIRTKKFSRTFLFQLFRNEFTIEDSFAGRKHHSIHSFFHVSPECRVDQLNGPQISISRPEQNFNMIISANQANVEIQNDHCFDAYGKKQGAKTIVCSTRQSLPTRIKYKFSW